MGVSVFTLEEKLVAALNRARLAAHSINPFHSSETLSAKFSYYCRHSEQKKQIECCTELMAGIIPVFFCILFVAFGSADCKDYIITHLIFG